MNRTASPFRVITLTVLIASLLAALLMSVPSSVKAQQDSRQLKHDEAGQQRERRLALVIGNGKYENAPVLKNPTNDANDMAVALSNLGFTVEHGVDLTQKQMKFMIRQFGQKLKAGGQGVFYYAGHGVQSKGRNYLIPVDALIESDADLEDAGVDVQLMLNYMDDAQNGVNVVILDACRNNPFGRSMRSVENGLAQVDAPTGTLIAYSTAPGRVASDGQGKNGLYTSELLKQMRAPGVSVTEMFMRVRAEVVKQTGGKQVPWEASSLIGSFSFNAATNSGGIAVNKSPGGATSAPAVNPAAVEIEYWETIKNSTDAEDFREYLKEYPAGPHVVIARSNLRRLEVTGTKNPPNTNTLTTSPAKPSETVLLTRVMNTAFADDYSGKIIKVLARFVAPGQMENYIFGAIPRKSIEGKVAFRVSSPDQTIGEEVPFGVVPPHVFIDRAQADLIFELKKGDLILLTGTTIIGRKPISGAQDFIQVVFVANSIEKIK